MAQILDTHTFLWYISADSQLSAMAKNEIERKGAENYVSLASIWELSIKVSLRKIDLLVPFQELLRHIEGNGFKLLDIVFTDTLHIVDLPFHHRDPFDRLLIAQAISNGFSIITADKEFKKYNIPVIW